MQKKIILYCNQIIEIGLLVLLAGTACIFSPDTESTFLLPKEIFAQLVILFIGAAWLVRIITEGKFIVSKTPLLAPLLAVIAVVLFSMINAGSIYLALRDFAWMVMFIVLYCIVVDTIKTERQVEAILKILLIVGGLTALYGLLQYQGIYILNRWAKHIIKGKEVFSIFGNPNFFSEYLVIITPVALILVLYEKNVLGKTTAGLSFILMCLAVLVTRVRGSWLGFIASFIFLFGVLLFTDKKALFNKRIILVLLTIIIIISLIIFVTGLADKYFLPTITERFTSIFDLKGFSQMTRLLQWGSTLEMVKEHPFLGVGLGNFKIEYLNYQAEFLKDARHRIFWSYIPYSNAKHVHNEYLQIIAETGLLGVIAAIWFISIFWRNSFNLLKKTRDRYGRSLAAGIIAGLIAVMVQGIFSFPFHLVTTFSVFVVLAGLLTVNARIYRSQGPDVLQAQWRFSIPAFFCFRWRLIAVIVIVLITVFLSTAVIRPFIAAAYLKRGIEFSKLNEDNMAISVLKKGRALDPYNGQVHFVLAMLYDKGAKYAESQDEFKNALKTFNDKNIYRNLAISYTKENNINQAIVQWEYFLAIDPADVMAHGRAALLYEQKSMLDKAIAEYQKMISLEPAQADFHYNLGVVYFKNGQENEAVGQWLKAIEINPDHINAHTNIGMIYYKNKMREKALSHWRKILTIDPDNKKIKSLLTQSRDIK